MPRLVPGSAVTSDPLTAHPRAASGRTAPVRRWPEVAAPRRRARCASSRPAARRSCSASGRADAELMFVGEGPGEQEDLQGEPFVGRAGPAAHPAHRGHRADPRRRVHRERREVPAAGQPRSAARRDRGVRAVARPPARADPARGHRHARQLRHEAAARTPRRASPSCAARSSRSRARVDGRADPDAAPVGGAAVGRRGAGRGARRLRARQARARPSADVDDVPLDDRRRRRDARRSAQPSGRSCRAGDVVVLDGDLGAGKTDVREGARPRRSASTSR